MKKLIIALCFFISVSTSASVIKLCKVVYFQKGVKNSKGVSGMYAYYKKPNDKNFNVEKHRFFISNLEYFKLVNNKK